MNQINIAEIFNRLIVVSVKKKLNIVDYFKEFLNSIFQKCNKYIETIHKKNQSLVVLIKRLEKVIYKSIDFIVGHSWVLMFLPGNLNSKINRQKN
jgi:hypothetical protein